MQSGEDHSDIFAPDVVREDSQFIERLNIDDLRVSHADDENGVLFMAVFDDGLGHFF